MEGTSTYTKYTNTSSYQVGQKNHSPLWDEFCHDPRTLSDLQNSASQWLSSEAGKDIYIKWNNKFKAINEKQRLYYVASYGTSASGVPWVKCVIKDHKNNYTNSFDCKAARRDLFEQYKAGRFGSTYTPPPKSQAGDKKADEARAKAQAEQQHQDALQAKAKAKAREQADLAWSKANTDLNGSVYLKNKGLLPIGVETFIRYYFHVVVGYLICVVVDVENQIKGYQKIADKKILINGEKRDKKFIYGTETKGNFVPLGALDDTTRVVYVAEGVASGISVKEGLKLIASQTPPSKNGKPKPQPVVLCALFAGNISAVVEAVNKKYPKLKRIYIPSDNDQWKENEINEKTGLKKGNAGLIASNKAALKNKKVRVITPDFTGFDTSKKPSDFNDLQQLAGIEEVAKQLKQAKRVDPYYAFFQEKQKECKRREQLFSKHILKNYNERYLTNIDGLVNQITESKAKNILLDSAIGTAKTEIATQVVKQRPNDTVIIISHLISLTGQGGERFECEFYGDIKGTRQNLSEIQKISCCLNSLPMFIRKGKIRTAKIVVIDEIEQLLARLTTHIDNKPIVLKCLEHLVRSAELLIVADAHISQRTMHVLEEWREGKFLCINNTYEVGTGRKIIFHELKGSVLKDAADELLKGGRVALFSNDKKLAYAGFNLLQPIAEFMKGKSLYISGDNNNDFEVVEAFNNPQEAFKQYNLIVCTPSVNTGVSIVDPSITFVGGMFRTEVNSACDAMQALGRIRNTKEIHCWIDEKRNNFPTNKKQIIAEWTATYEYDRHLMGFNDEDTLTISDPVYEQLVYDVTRATNISKNNFFGHFLKLAAFDGYSIEYKELSQEQKKECLDFQKRGYELEKKKYIDSCANEVDYNDEQADEVEKKSRRTFQQTRALTKYKNKKFYRLPDNASVQEVTKTLELDDRDKLKSKVLTLENTLSTDEQLKAKYLADQKSAKEKGNIERLRPDWKHYATKREFFLAVLLAVGITKQLQIEQIPSKDDPEKTEAYTYSKESETISSLINYVINKRNILEGIVNIPTDKKLKDNPLQFVGYQLKKLGLAQDRLEHSNNAAYKIREVGLGSLDSMRELLTQRGVVEGLTGNKTTSTEPENVNSAHFPIIYINKEVCLPQSVPNVKVCLTQSVPDVKVCPPQQEHPLTKVGLESGATFITADFGSSAKTDSITSTSEAPSSPEIEAQAKTQANLVITPINEELEEMKKNNSPLKLSVFSPIERDNLLSVLKTSLDNPNFKEQNKAMYYGCKDLLEGFQEFIEQGIDPNPEAINALRDMAKRLTKLSESSQLELVKEPIETEVITPKKVFCLHPDTVKTQVSDFLSIVEKNYLIPKEEILRGKELVRAYLVAKSHNYKGELPEPYKRASRDLGEFYKKYQRLIDKDFAIKEEYFIEMQVA